MNELQIKVTAKLGAIEVDIESIKKSITDKVAIYKGVIVTDDTIDRAKKDIAMLNRDKKELNDCRIAAKKTYMKPCDEIDLKVKELDAIYDTAVKEIKDQLDAFEEKRKTDKKAAITLIYDGLIGEIKDYLPLEKIYDTKWENVSVTPKSIISAIESLVSSTVVNIATIKGMNSEIEIRVLEQYKLDLSLTNAITTINRYEAQKAEILAKEEARRKAEDERKAELERERIKKEERQKIADEERIRAEITPVSKPVHIQKVEPVLAVDDYEDIPFASERPFIPGKAWTTYEILCSAADLETVDAQLNMFGIKFRRA